MTERYRSEKKRTSASKYIKGGVAKPSRSVCFDLFFMLFDCGFSVVELQIGIEEDALVEGSDGQAQRLR